MAVIDLTELQTPLTEEQALTKVLAIAQQIGFNTTSWHSGSMGRTLVQIIAKVYEELSKIGAAVSKQGYNEYATGTALTVLSRNHYQNTRAPAKSTIGLATLTASASSGPHTFAVGDVIGETADGKGYVNTTGGTLNAGSTLELSFQAEGPGADYNVANSTITSLRTAIAGVSITNPAQAGTGTWITSAGADEEQDPVLKVRNETKWPTLSYAAPGRGYQSMALDNEGTGVSTSITRVFVDDTNPQGPNTIDIYVATSAGAVSAPDVALIQAYIAARKPTTAVPEVISATPVPQTLTGTVYHDGTREDASLRNDIETAIAAYLGSIPIGGTKIAGAGIASKEKIEAAIMGVIGVVDYDPSTPGADITVTKGQIITLTTPTSLTFIEQ